MGDIFIHYLKQEVQNTYTSVCKKIKRTPTFIFNKIKNLQQFCLSFYLKRLSRKTVRLIIIFPMFLILLSGFIEDKKNSVYGTLSYSGNQMYPLTQNFIPVIPVPNSGIIPINHNITNFFAQYETSEKLSVYNNIHSSPQQENFPLRLIALSETTKNNRSTYAHLEDIQSATPQIDPLLPTPSLDSNVVQNSYSQRKREYTPYARNYARKYGLDSNMIIAIMYAESTFFPHVISSKNAHGLMQVVPATAGTEVNRFFRKKGEPSLTELMNPEINIRYGTTYLYLLKRYHLTGISDPKIKKLLAIASYNAGSGAILRHFAKNRTEAINRVNEMTFDEVLTTILTTYRSTETRRYVAKVLAYMNRV